MSISRPRRTLPNPRSRLASSRPFGRRCDDDERCDTADLTQSDSQEGSTSTATLPTCRQLSWNACQRTFRSSPELFRGPRRRRRHPDVLANRLLANIVSEMTDFLSSWTWNENPVMLTRPQESRSRPRVERPRTKPTKQQRTTNNEAPMFRQHR